MTIPFIQQIPIQVIKDIGISFLYFIIFIVIGYITGRIVKLLIKYILQDLLGLDKALERKNIKVFNSKVSEVVGNFVKDIIYILFVAFSFEYMPFLVMNKIGEYIIEVVYYIFIFIISILISYILIEVFLIELLSKINIKDEYKKFIVGGLRFILYYISILLILNYMGFLSPVLLYIFEILFAGVVITLSLIFGISFGYSFRKYSDKILEDLFEKYENK